MRFKPLLISLNPNLLEPEPEDYRQLKISKEALTENLPFRDWIYFQDFRMRVGMLADPAMHWSQSWMTYHHPHAMTRIKSIIKCIISKPGYNGNKQLESREH